MTWKVKAKKPSPTATLGIALDSSEIVLSTLANAVKLTPVPYVQDAAGLALGIINMIQNVKGNKQAFQRLADDACALVYIILCSDNRAVSAATVTPALLDNARELVDTLHEIYNYAKRQTSRNRILRIIQHKSDAGTIQEYRERLKQSLDVFSLKSSMSVQHTLASIQERLELCVHRSSDRGLHKSEARSPASPHIITQDAAPDQEHDDVKNPTEDTEMHRDTGKIEEGREQTRPGDPEYRMCPETSLSGPIPASQPSLFFGHHFTSLGFPSAIHSPHSAGENYMSVGGDQNSYTGSVINTNSGNTTSHVVSNSNNDSSSRIYHGKRRQRYSFM